MSNTPTSAEGTSLFHYGSETLVVEKLDDTVSISLEPVHILSVNGGIALTGIVHAADYLDVHPNTIRRYVDKGMLMSQRRPSGYRRIRVDSLKEVHEKMYRAAHYPYFNVITRPAGNNANGANGEVELLKNIETAGRDDLGQEIDPESQSRQYPDTSLGKIGVSETIKLNGVPIVETPPEGYIGISLERVEAVTQQEDGIFLWMRPDESGSDNLLNKYDRLEAKERMDFMNGAVSIDLDKRVLVIEGHMIHLQKRQFEVLHYLAVNKGILLTREQITEAVWGAWFGSTNVVDVNISVIRKNFGEYGSLIHTKRGYGYVFDDAQS